MPYKRRFQLNQAILFEISVENLKVLIRIWFSKGKNRIDVGKTKMCFKFWTLVAKIKVWG